MVTPSPALHELSTQALELGAKIGVVPIATSASVANSDGLAPDGVIARLLGSQREAVEQFNQPRSIGLMGNVPHAARVGVTFTRGLLIDGAKSGHPRALGQQQRVVAAKGDPKLAPHASVESRAVVTDREAALAVDETSEPVSEVIRNLGVFSLLHGSSVLSCLARGVRSAAGPIPLPEQQLSHTKGLV